MNGHAIAETARRYVGTRFRHQGRDARTGIDCVGLAVLIARDLKLEHVDSVTYARCPNPRNLLATLARCCDRVSRLADPLSLEHDTASLGVARTGDLLVFSPLRPSLPRHVAVFVGEGIVHAIEGSGINRVVEAPLSGDWLKDLHSTWRFRWQP